jgi:hypothetical protein
MNDKEFFYRVLGLSELWQVESNHANQRTQKPLGTAEPIPIVSQSKIHSPNLLCSSPLAPKPQNSPSQPTYSHHFYHLPPAAPSHMTHEPTPCAGPRKEIPISPPPGRVRGKTEMKLPFEHLSPGSFIRA